MCGPHQGVVQTMQARYLYQAMVDRVAVVKVAVKVAVVGRARGGKKAVDTAAR